MIRITLALVGLWCLRLASAVPTRRWSSSTGRALYVQDNNPSGNSIIAAHISPDDGTLSPGSKTSTGGLGLNQLAVISQDSVVVADEYLFVTNAGSDTLSVFKINASDPTQLSSLGEPAPTKAHTPTSVTYSSALNMACVLNAGNKAGVACYTVDPYQGLIPLDFFLPIPQTEDFDPDPAPPGALTIAQDIRFNPSSTAVFVTVRSNGGRPGLLYAWSVSPIGTVSDTPAANSSLSALPIPFSLNFLSNDRVFVTNDVRPPFPAAAILSLDPLGQVIHVQNITLKSAKAACWAAFDPATNTIAVVDAITPIVNIVDAASGAVLNSFNVTTPTLAGQDTRISGNGYLYLLTDPYSFATLELADPPQVLVYDTAAEKAEGVSGQVQSFEIFAGGQDESPYVMGMAIFPAPLLT